MDEELDYAFILPQWITQYSPHHGNIKHKAHYENKNL